MPCVKLEVIYVGAFHDDRTKQLTPIVGRETEYQPDYNCQSVLIGGIISLCGLTTLPLVPMTPHEACQSDESKR